MLGMLPLIAVGLLFAAPADREKGLRDAVWGGHFVAGTRAYEELVQKHEEPSAQASYLAGFAYWKLHQAEKAESLVKRAVEAHFRAGGGRIQPGDLLDRINRFVAAKPSDVEVEGLDRSLIDPYSDEQSDATRPFLEALPRFTRIGRDIFGEVPPVRFFLFAKSPAMQRLYDSLEIVKHEGSTGMANLVVVCAAKAHRSTEAETISMALHETAHAWVQTYLLARNDRQVRMPAYVGEGLAVYVAGLWSKDLAPLAPERLKHWHDTGRPAPAFDKVRAFEDFHDADASYGNYLAAGLLMERLLGPPESGAKKIPALLDAFAASSDDTEVWRSVTGKDVRAEFDGVVSDFWK
jgi:hypothetical protein